MPEPIVYAFIALTGITVYLWMEGEFTNGQFGVMAMMNVLYYYILADSPIMNFRTLESQVISTAILYIMFVPVLLLFLAFAWEVWLSKILQYRGLEVVEYDLPNQDGRTKFHHTEEMFREKVFSQVEDYEESDIIKQSGKCIVVENETHGRKLIREKE